MSQELSVIVNPDRFVEEKRFHRQPTRVFVPRAHGTDKRKYLCDGCLYGKHECSDLACPCDCRHAN